MSQTVITQPCYGAMYAITCHFFIYAPPGASSNVTSEKSCGNAVPTPLYPWTYPEKIILGKMSCHRTVVQ